MAKDLEELRERLDAVDRSVITALAERLALIEQVASCKESDAGELRDLVREGQVLARLEAMARSAGLDGTFVTRLYRQIMDHSLRLQREYLAARDNPQRKASGSCVVAYQGTEGAYSHLAAMRHFGPATGEARYEGRDTFREVAEDVRRGAAGYGVLPVENTTAGSINEVYDLLTEFNLSIVGEEIETVDHCLLGLEGVELAQIRRVLSHPQALAQCSRFLSTLGDCRIEPYTDTAMAAQRVRDDGDPSQAAIASEDAGRRYGLEVIERGISNQTENYTRFLVVSDKPLVFRSPVGCKTSIMFVVRHEPGALARCLTLLAERGLNLTKLESRPKPRRPWEYMFYADFEGNTADESVRDVLRELAVHTAYLKTFGSYPALTTAHARQVVPLRSSVPTLSAGDEDDDDEGAGAIDEPVALSIRDVPYPIASRESRGEDTRIVVRHVTIGGERPVVIAGPCAVESREQLRACAQAVRDADADILRGGCFKPRTSPYSFQGLGHEGLDLLEEVGRDLELPTITEVMHPRDVEAVAAKSDILQIGARNMQNTALLKEVGAVDFPVMLKRGMMASIDEWLSAAEYILAQGNQQVILCERGIRTFETATRNTLDLSAVPVVRERTHLPVIVDPSHACGNWRWVPAMARAALAGGAQGIMVEIHPNPDAALSDGAQALRLETFRKLMASIRSLVSQDAAADGVAT